MNNSLNNLNNNQRSSVSIVLPTYNQCHFIIEAIKTLLDQSYRNFELIVVDDGSTDATSAILASIQHPQLRVLNQAHQGLTSALNHGFSVARGNYWTWSAANNVMSPTWLEELVNALDNCPAEVGYAFSSYAVINEFGKTISVNRDQRFDLPSLLLRYVGNASFLYRAELAKKVGQYDTQLSGSGDLDMWVRMAEQTSAVHVDSVLCYYRQQNESNQSAQDDVSVSTAAVINKFLAKNSGVFNIDKLFPSIALSADPVLERWKARIYLSTLGANAPFYCPVESLVDQLTHALNEKYEPTLIANIVHLLASSNQWEIADRIVAIYLQRDNSEYLRELKDITARKSGLELQQIPFATIDEKMLACDCSGSRNHEQLLRNLVVPSTSINANQFGSVEMLVADLINQLDNDENHDNIWKNFASFKSPEEKNTLQMLQFYLLELINLPQDHKALGLLKIVEAMCHAYSVDVQSAKNKLIQLQRDYANLPVLTNAIRFLDKGHAYQNEQCEEALV